MVITSLNADDKAMYSVMVVNAEIWVYILEACQIGFPT